MMIYDKHKYIGFLGLLALVGLKGLATQQYVWCLFFVNLFWFTFFYENSMVYHMKAEKAVKH